MHCGLGRLHRRTRTADQFDLAYFGFVRCTILIARLQNHVWLYLLSRSIHDEQVHLYAGSFALTLMHDVRSHLNEIRISKQTCTTAQTAHHFELFSVDRSLGGRVRFERDQELEYKILIQLVSC